MILKNYKVLKLACNLSTGSSSTGLIYLPASYKDKSGNSYNTLYAFGYNQLAQQSFSGSAPLAKEIIDFAVGTGSTPASIEDYILESDASASFSGKSLSASYANVGANYDCEITISAFGKNNTASPITISEIGIYNTGVARNGNDKSTVLLFREVLETPLVVQPNETYHFTLVWTES